MRQQVLPNSTILKGMNEAEQWLQDHKIALGASGIETDSLSVDGRLASIDLASIDWLGKSRDPRVIEELMSNKEDVGSDDMSAFKNSDRVYIWIRSLPLRLRKSWLLYAEGHDQYETALRQGVTQGTVSRRLRAVKCHLRIRSLTDRHKLPSADKLFRASLRGKEPLSMSRLSFHFEIFKRQHRVLEELWSGYVGPIVWSQRLQTSQPEYSRDLNQMIELVGLVDPQLGVLAEAARIAFTHERGLCKIDTGRKRYGSRQGTKQSESRKAIVDGKPPELSDLNQRIYQRATKLWPHKKDK